MALKIRLARGGAKKRPFYRIVKPAEEVLSAGADGLAVLVQSGTGGQPGPILGAAETEIAVLDLTTTAARLARDPY
ncbi:hypothetical protein ACIKTA_10255 [Hansschlegelia beijingensis]